MRIITGTARGTRLQTLEGENTRPTSEKVKEAIFSIIQFDLQDKRVLDLFGGSGQLALEALSRGAEFAVIADNSREATEIIKANAQKTKLMPKCRIVTTDWKDFVKNCKEQFSLVFLDPPYKDGLLDEIINLMIEKNIIADNAIIVCESGIDGVLVPMDDAVQKCYRYGSTYITVVRKGVPE
ncbi:16S rRNA (guanine(966)-N(2))-methyltransferase RsmD [Eubacteriales bacterium OttesenSCG-928-G02]|nr:16S rRNA (guanine(966)-N(2))-methyltransferase RsmD [Eubacteriales bacterium OttesenSCG-928-G02]